MKHLASIFIPVALFALTTLPAAADDKHTHMHTEGEAATQNHQGTGTVNSVNVKAGKVNLNHEPIASLDWPAMKMDFEVKDKASVNKLKPGQKITFKLIEVRKGKYVISEFAVVK